MIPKLIEKFRTNIEKTALKLNKSLPLADFPEGTVKEAIAFAYSSESVTERAIAVVINAAVASRKERFLMSRALLKECFKNDPHVDVKDFSGDTASRIMGSLVGCGLLERLTEATDRPGANRKAATYRVIDPEVLSLIVEPINHTVTKTFTYNGGGTYKISLPEGVFVDDNGVVKTYLTTRKND